MKRLITFALVVLITSLAGCDDDQVPTPPPEEQAEEAEEAETVEDDEKTPPERAGESTYEGLAESYSELESAYEGMDGAPAGMADRMHEWGRQMMYMNQHDGHMKGGPPKSDDGGMGMHDMKDGEPGYGPHMPASMSGFGEWHRQMSDFHQAEAKERSAAGDTAIAKQHEHLVRHHAAMAESLADDEKRESIDVTEENLAKAGESLYVNACATCHAADGTGVTKAFPPLAGAEIVTGDPTLLTRITLHGMEGPLRVKDQNYNGMMPSFAGRFSNDELAAILTYIRSTWGNEAGAITTETVTEVRQKYKDSPGALSTIKEGLAPTVE